MRWYSSSSKTVHIQQYALPVMLVIPGAFIGAAVNSASWTSHIVQCWCVVSSVLGHRAMGGSLVTCGGGRNRVVLSRLHLSLCVTTGSSPSPLESAGDVYTCFPLVHLWKFHMSCMSAPSVSSR